MEDVFEGLFEGKAQNGENDDGHVEDVPRLREVVKAEADELEDALGGEQADEHDVEAVKESLESIRGSKVFGRHNESIQKDQSSHRDVEVLVGDEADGCIKN